MRVNRSLSTILLLLSIACEEEQVVVDCNETDLTLEVSKLVYADCGKSNGQITLTASGGSGPYRYSMDGSTLQNSPVFENVLPGFREMSVRDKNNCVATKRTFMTSEDPFPVAIFTTGSGCGTSNGKIEVVPLGGVAPFKFQLGENNDDYQSTGIWTGLHSQMYSVWVEDVNKCFFGVYMYVPSGVKYSESVKPIIDNKCATAGCHDGTVTPDFRSFTIVKGNATQIRSAVVNKTMPPGESLSPEEINLVKCWVDDGAPNN